MVDLNVLCNSLLESECASQLAVELRPLFIFLAVLLFVLMIFQVVWVSSKIKKKGVVFWVGFVVFNISYLLLIVLFYFMIPFFIRWFNIIKV
jgi:hypothetical protein